jgi:hypothetical protein
MFVFTAEELINSFFSYNEDIDIHFRLKEAKILTLLSLEQTDDLYILLSNEAELESIVSSCLEYMDCSSLNYKGLKMLEILLLGLYTLEGEEIGESENLIKIQGSRNVKSRLVAKLLFESDGLTILNHQFCPVMIELDE